MMRPPSSLTRSIYLVSALLLAGLRPSLGFKEIVVVPAGSHHCQRYDGIMCLRGGGQESTTAPPSVDGSDDKPVYGRISKYEYVLTPEQIEAFHRDGCVTIENVLTEQELRDELDDVCQQLLTGAIAIPGKDFCDMSQPFGVPMDQWNLVNSMLPSKYAPSLRGNVYERLTAHMASQLFPHRAMVQDYDQLLNKRPNKTDAVFAWHQDMAYWPGTKALGGVNITDTCTFSLALDDSDKENGCLRYVVGSGVNKTLREHRPLCRDRDEGHAVTVDVLPHEEVRLAPAKRGSLTIHDEFVVHGSGGNTSPTRERRTYVVAYRAREIVEAERKIGFTHSHNDIVNWDTFNDGERHRVKSHNNKDKEES